MFIACLFKGSQEQSFFLQTLLLLLLTTFLVTVLKNLTYTLVSHDPWSAHDGSTSNEKCTPAYNVGPTCYFVAIRAPR